MAVGRRTLHVSPEAEVRAPRAWEELVQHHGKASLVIRSNTPQQLDMTEAGEESPSLNWGIGLGADTFHVMPYHVGERSPRTPSKECLLVPELEYREGVPGVHHPDEDAARTQDPAHLGNYSLRTPAVMDHAPGIDDIEAGLAERQRLGIEPLQRGPEPIQRETLAC